MFIAHPYKVRARGQKLRGPIAETRTWPIFAGSDLSLCARLNDELNQRSVTLIRDRGYEQCEQANLLFGEILKLWGLIEIKETHVN